jgi:hypothetical protein
MITCSYRGYFNSYLNYKLYKFIIYLNKYTLFQKYLLSFILQCSNDPKLMALQDYIGLLNSSEYNPSIKRYSKSALEKLNKYEQLDIYDLCKENYPATQFQPDISLHEIKGEITYVVEKSGFFSTIFSVTSVVFYCLKNNIKLHLDWSEWVYSYDISYLFDDEKKQIFENKCRGQQTLFKNARIFIDKLESCDLREYFEYRKFIIQKLYNAVLPQVNSEYLVNCKYQIAIFIRRGDKLINESYPISLGIYTKILKSYPNLLILGDDYYFNKSLSRHIAGSKTLEIMGYKPRGGYLNNSGDVAVKSILTNFISLCMASKVIGDPYCNLVAAALIYRGENRSYDLRIAPWSLRNYV